MKRKYSYPENMPRELSKRIKLITAATGMSAPRALCIAIFLPGPPPIDDLTRKRR